MPDSSWVPVIATAVGAIIALTGTLLAGVRNERGQRRRDLESERLRGYLEFALALAEAHNTLRIIARADRSASDYDDMVVHAVWESNLYVARERLLLSGSEGLVRAAEVAFLRLIDIRDVIRAGAALSGPNYHDAYHAFADALWQFRMAARGELGQPLLAPAELGHASWSERNECPVCRQSSTSS